MNQKIQQDILFDNKFQIEDDKRKDGRFYTEGNPFHHQQFQKWADIAKIPKEKILEPFAGSNNLIKMLKSANLCNQFKSYDISPSDESVIQKDTIRDFPKGFNVCVTNPPWLARNSATRRRLPYPKTKYDDMYKHCLDISLKNCGYVAALIPESFICSKQFLPRLDSFISLNQKMFSDTDHPVGLALFHPIETRSKKVYFGNKLLGTLEELKGYLPKNNKKFNVKFNTEDGNLGFIGLDNTKGRSIRFCDIEELKDYQVRHTSRVITKIKTETPMDIKKANEFIENFRNKTNDVFLTAYRGLRKDGMYRRRMDYALTRDIIINTLSTQ